MNPKLSVITINYNNREGLQKTIESVINQSFRNFEYIIIDGASNDDSVDVIKKYKNQINYWVSENDKGIFHAMNKGIAMAEGEYLIFMNSGDNFVDEYVLEKVFALDIEKDYVFGDFNLVEKGKIILENGSVENTNPTLKTLMFNTLPHAASFIKKRLFEKYGKYDESLKNMSDWTFALQVIVFKNCSLSHIPITICNYDMGGISSTTRETGRKEMHQELERLFPPRILADYKDFRSFRSEKIKLTWLKKHPFFYSLYQYIYKIGKKMEKYKLIKNSLLL